MEFHGIPSRLCLEAVIKTCMKLTNAECTVEKLLMIGREDVRNMQSFITK
jgi:hypothetical protein